MLYVTADFDVSTPTEKATWMWKNQAKSNSTLVVRHGDDHVSWNCKPSSVATFALFLFVCFFRTAPLPPFFFLLPRLNLITTFSEPLTPPLEKSSMFLSH